MGFPAAPPTRPRPIKESNRSTPEDGLDVRARNLMRRRHSSRPTRRFLERHGAFLGPLVLPQPRKGRGAHLAVFRELEEVRLDDDLRLCPEPDVRVDLGDFRERAPPLTQREKPFE